MGKGPNIQKPEGGWVFFFLDLEGAILMGILLVFPLNHPTFFFFRDLAGPTYWVSFFPLSHPSQNKSSENQQAQGQSGS